MRVMSRIRKCVLGAVTAAALCLTNVAARGDDGYRLLQIDGRNVKWGVAGPGTGASITYAVATVLDGDAGITNCRAVTGIGALLEHSGLTAGAFGEALNSALAMWEKAGNLHFVPTPSAAEAELLIGSETAADGIAYADVTPVSSDTQGFSRIAKGVVCLNPQRRWVAGSSSAVSVTDRKSYDLAYVLAHEIGHVLGLDHPGPKGELMSFEYSGGIHALQAGDVAGIVALYGPSLDRGPAPVVARNGIPLKQLVLSARPSGSN